MDLPAGYTWRRATPDDVSAICALVIAIDVMEYGEPDYEESDVREDFARERFDLATDTWCVHAPDGTLHGYATTWDKRPHELVTADVFCHPDAPDLYPTLVDTVTRRAAEHAAVAGTTTVHAFNSEPNTARAAALQAAGYDVCRVFRRMTLDLAEPTPPPAPGPGVTIRNAGPDDLRTVWRVIGESFADHFDFVAESYEGWHARFVDTETYRPAYWWVAEVDGEPVGALIGQEWEDGTGWVKSVGVLRSARGRGVATALLLTSFEAFRRDGRPRAGLGVDSANVTGAMALYERIGLRAEHRYDCYERVLTNT